jgi:hypothetical protein
MLAACDVLAGWGRPAFHTFEIFLIEVDWTGSPM